MSHVRGKLVSTVYPETVSPSSFTSGLSGSLTQLTDGSSYLISGDNINIVSESNGAVTISSDNSLGVITKIGGLSGLVNEYDTINEAIDAAIFGDSINIPVGRYYENLELPLGVSLKGIGTRSFIQIMGLLTGSGTRLVLSGQNEIDGITIVSAVNSDPAVLYLGALPSTMANIRVIGSATSSIGVKTIGTNTLGTFNCLYTGIFDANVVVSGSGDILLRDSIHNTSASSLLRSDYDMAQIYFETLRTYEASSHVRGLEILQPASLTGRNVHISTNVRNAIYLGPNSDGTIIEISDADIESNEWDFYADPIASGTNTRIHLNLLKARLEKTFMTPTFAGAANILTFFIDDGIKDDNAFVFAGNMSVGLPILGSESVFGEGNSSTSGMVVITDDGTGTTFTNVTEEAATKNSGSFTFQGTTANNVIYIGNTGRKFRNIKYDISVAAVTGSGFFVHEIWNGAAWTTINGMATQADSTYLQLGNAYWESVNSEQLRLGNGATYASWASSSIDSTSSFWMRSRISGTVTTAPTFTRTKIGTNRTEINKDGFVEHFGDGEVHKDIQWHYNLSDDLSGASPANVAISFSPNVVITPIDNSYSNNALDGIGGMLQIPYGLDTSRPITYTVFWKPLGNGAGDVELEMNIIQVKEGYIINGTLSEIALSNIITLSGQQDQLIKTQFDIDVADLVPDEFIAFSFFRDGTAGNADDTFGSAIAICQSNFKGYYWA